jgi:hypothetical protein
MAEHVQKRVGMAMAGDQPTIIGQRPRLRPVPQESMALPAGEASGMGLRAWTREFLEYRHLIALSSVFVLVALFADYRCGMYVTAVPSAKVPDLILDSFEPVDFGFLFEYGYMALIVGLFLYPLFFRVRMLHVVAVQFSLLLMLRSVSMIFTHLGTPAGCIPVEFPWFFSKLYFENDMFFSGHTAMPFLGFYLFRRSPLRYVFLVGAVVMAMVVLGMHMHYSIDVLAAFFMTYCSYQMGAVLLRKINPTDCE